MNREDYEEYQRQNAIMSEHDCVNNPEECEVLHPLTCKVGSCGSINKPSDFYFPRKWREWLVAPKVILTYFDRHSLTKKTFNVSEVFDQLSSKVKIGVLVSMFANLLDDEEKSLFVGTIMQPKCKIEDEDEQQD